MESGLQENRRVLLAELGIEWATVPGGQPLPKKSKLLRPPKTQQQNHEEKSTTDNQQPMEVEPKKKRGENHVLPLC